MDDMEKSNRLASSVDEFCLENSISRSFYYELQKTKRGPRTMKVGARRLITREAGAEWRRRMEAATEEAEAERDTTKAGDGQ